MENLYFNLLKEKIQTKYLEKHTPSFDEISKWKGIDIIYFQEDLRKIAKGNISEKSFYTYFKGNSNSKIPRIDILNLLSVYVGYDSWTEFKKENKIIGDGAVETYDEQQYIEPENIEEKPILQIRNNDNEIVEENRPLSKKYIFQKKYKEIVWTILTIILGILAILLGFKDDIFGKTYTYCFTDADRSAGIRTNIEIKVYKQNESPLLYKIKAGDCFRYHTKDKNLVMEISSPFYENVKVTRNLENAPNEEIIELKPDDYKFAFYYFSLKDVSENSSEIINQKRKELQNRISNDAIIKQIYDSDIYGVEMISKEKYITLVTTPTTSLKNLNLLEMKRNDKGKIISIKFKINDNEIK